MELSGFFFLTIGFLRVVLDGQVFNGWCLIKGVLLTSMFIELLVYEIVS